MAINADRVVIFYDSAIDIDLREHLEMETEPLVGLFTGDLIVSTELDPTVNHLINYQTITDIATETFHLSFTDALLKTLYIHRVRQNSVYAQINVDEHHFIEMDFGYCNDQLIFDDFLRADTFAWKTQQDVLNYISACG